MQTLNVLKLLSYHVLHGAYTLEQLYMHSDLNDDVDTLLSGHPLNVTKTGNDYSIDNALVVDPNIAAINGYIHIIDKVLEPYPIPADQQNPYIVDLLTSQNLTIFRDFLTSTGFIDTIDNLEEDFTLFVPNNTAFTGQQLNMSMRYLSSYGVGELLTSKVFYNSKRSKTMMGGMFQITWSKTWKETRVNDALIVRQDLMVDGGVVHVIDGLFDPVLNRCDERKVFKERSFCEACGIDDANCPVGFTQVSSFRVPTCNYTINGRRRTGCYSFCEKVEETKDCCPSFYGLQCRVCPGGIDYPCTGHGKCEDGIDRTGVCTCDENFTGQACDVCIEGKRGLDCNETITCKHNNGYCHPDANCSGPDMDVTCKCKDGYFGDGKNCTHWCTVNNGGCLGYANCSWDAMMDSIKCKCPDNMYGDGKSWCKIYVDHCEPNNGGCHPDANCSFALSSNLPSATPVMNCTCRSGFVGNGYQCYADLYTTINELNTTKVFAKMLKTSSESNPDILDLLDKLHNSTEDYTIFIPVDYADSIYSRNDVANMIVEKRVTLDRTINTTVYMSMAGKPLEVRFKFVNYTDVFSVNDVTITDMNITSTNGIILFTNKPLLYPISNEIPDAHEVKLSEDAKFLLKVVIGSIAGVAVVAIIIGLVAGRLKRRSMKQGDDTKNLIATFSKEGSEDLGFGPADNEGGDDEPMMAQNKKRKSCEISYGHSFNNPLYETGPESNVASFPF